MSRRSGETAGGPDAGGAAEEGRGGAAERGMTLVEVLLAGALMVVVLFAVLGVADGFGSRARANADLTAAQESARQAVDAVTRELRSAGPGGGAPTVLRSDPADLVFVTDAATGAGGQVRAVRYCWDGAALHRQMSAAGAITMPAAACPAAGWGTGGVLMTGVEAPPFAVSPGGSGTTSVAITIDSDAAAPLQSAVTLRNRAVGPDDVQCTPTGGDTALLGLGVGVGQLVQIPVAFADLLGLRALLFGASAPPVSWQCP